MTAAPTPPRRRRLAAPATVAAAAVAVCGFVVWADPTTPGGAIPVCPTKSLLGIDCPLCGSSRMLYALLHLDVPGALRFNALGAAAVVIAVVAFVSWTVGRMRGPGAGTRRLPRWVPVAGVVVLGVWFVLRNLPFAPFTGLRV